MYNIDYIINELSYRVTTGKPDFTDHSHLQILVEILEEQKWPETSIVSAIRNILLLAEAGPKQPSIPSNLVKIYLQKGEKAPKGKKTKEGPNGGIYFLGSPREKQGRSSGNKKQKSKKTATDKKVIKPKELPTKGKKPKKLRKSKEELKFDKDGKLILSDKDKEIINTAAKTAKTQGNMLSDPAEVKLMKSFPKDVNTVLNAHGNIQKKLALAIVDKFGLTLNTDIDLGKNMKVYIRKINPKFRKIFSDEGNYASTLLAKVLQDTGALEDPGKLTRKVMVANKVFKKTTAIKIRKEQNGDIFIGNHKLYKAKNYGDFSNVKKILKQENPNLSDVEVERNAKFMERWVKKHNFVIEHIDNIVAGNELQVLSICDDCDMNTKEGLNKTKTIAINGMIKFMTKKLKSTMMSDTKDIIKGFEKLHTIEDHGQFKKQLNNILMLFNKNPQTKETANDLTEQLDFLRVLDSGQPVYFPSASNFKLGDLFAVPLKQPTIKEIAQHKGALGTIMVTLDNRSVKKGGGSPSASAAKISQSIFKSKDTQQHLSDIVDGFKDLIHNKNIKSADTMITDLNKRYSDILKSDPVYIKRMDQMDQWIKNREGRLHDDEVWKRYYQLGYMLQTIYNNEVDIQAFLNSDYKIKTGGIEHDVSDGIGKLAFLQFEPSLLKNGIPLNTYPTRMYHDLMEFMIQN